MEYQHEHMHTICFHLRVKFKGLEFLKLFENDLRYLAVKTK